jgi:hypothetical protein
VTVAPKAPRAPRAPRAPKAPAAPKAPRAPRKPRAPSPPFNALEALAAADAVLKLPPAEPHIQRVAGVGELVRRFALPIDLCPTTNSTRHRPIWALAKDKKNLFAVMMKQTRGTIRPVPLKGRPMLRCIRFSSREPDRYSDGFKMAIDRLMVGKERMGYLRDDSPRACQIEMWWEKSPPSTKGFCVIEIYTGTP